MSATGFIAGRLRYRGRIAMVSIALSFLVMIIAVSVSSGFRKELRDAVSAVSGDVRLLPSDLDWLSGSTPLERNHSCLVHIGQIQGVREIHPVIYRAGIVKNDDIVHGVLFKGVEDAALPDSVSMAASIPSRLSALLGAGEGENFNAYFIGDKVKVRKFHVCEVHEDIQGTDDKLVVYARLSDMQRLNGWNPDQVSAFEILLADNMRSTGQMAALSREIGAAALLYSGDDESSMVSVSAADSNPQLFDWLSLIDFNVFIVIALMTVVAGFNMISGLLILLFENIPTIGTLKSLGMTDRSIAMVFLRTSSSLVLKGMLLGNAAAFIFCAIQHLTRFITLDPENYFISYVPVHLEIYKIMAADAAAYIVIMLLLLLPSMFISKVDPARTVRVN